MKTNPLSFLNGTRKVTGKITYNFRFGNGSRTEMKFSIAPGVGTYKHNEGVSHCLISSVYSQKGTLPQRN